MDEQEYEYENGQLVCKKCGQEYSPDLDECPFCEAERQAKIITKHGSYKTRTATIAGLFMTIALVLGGIWLVQEASASGGWSIGREYVEEETVVEESVSAGITEQQTDIDTVESETEVEDTVVAEEEISDTEEMESTEELEELE